MLSTTYSLTTLKPSIFVIPAYKSLASPTRPTNEIRYEVHTFNELATKVSFVLENLSEQEQSLKKFRDENIFNIENSEQYLIDNMEYILQNKKHQDWVYAD